MISINDIKLIKLSKVDISETSDNKFNNVARVIADKITKNNSNTNLSVLVSKLRSGKIMDKRIIVPTEYLTNKDDDHRIIGAFTYDDGNSDVGDVKRTFIAGWTNVKTLKKWRVISHPKTFKAKINVTSMPCIYLNPIDTLPEVEIRVQE